MTEHDCPRAYRYACPDCTPALVTRPTWRARLADAIDRDRGYRLGVLGLLLGCAYFAGRSLGAI